jgi:hypothetical protein
MGISLPARFVCCAALGTVLWGAASEGAPPGTPRAAAVEIRSAGAGLDAALRAASAGKAPVWVAWSVPMAAGQGDVCCFEGHFAGRAVRRRGCRLDGRDHGVSISGAEVPDHAPGDLTLYALFEGGAMQGVRAYSADCPVDAGDARLVWLDDVVPAQSADLMSRQARATQRRGLGDDALVALALHADPTADAALIDLAGRSSPMEVREDAIFWLGQARGDRGYRELARLAAQESDARVLEKVAFSLSQSPVEEAGPTLERLATAHRDSKVREEAIFWMGQRGGAGVAGKLQRVAQEDADLEVRKKAVFALSQLDDGEGVISLVDLVRHGREAAVRKEALFWLGQSDDPRAMESLEALLLKR